MYVVCQMPGASIQSFIPKTLDQVKDAEEDAFTKISGTDVGDVYYNTVTGLKQALCMTKASSCETNGSCEEIVQLFSHRDSISCQEELERDEDNDYESVEMKSPGDKKEARKENKKKVKEEKREARKTKIPSAVRKRKKKLAKSCKSRP